MANATLYIIPIALIYSFLLMYIINYFLLRKHFEVMSRSYYLFLIVLLYIFLLIFGFIVSRNASDEQCGKKTISESLKFAHKTFLYASLTILALVYFPSIKTPFRELMGVNEVLTVVSNNLEKTIMVNYKADTFAMGYFIGLSLIVSSIAIYGKSVKEICKLSVGEIKSKVEVLDEELNKPFPEPAKKKEFTK